MILYHDTSDRKENKYNMFNKGYNTVVNVKVYVREHLISQIKSTSYRIEFISKVKYYC